MAHIHFEVPDELHRAIRHRAIERGESIREVGERLFQWYVDETDEDLLAACEQVANRPCEAIEMMRREGFVLDNLDDRWQKLAFTLYTMLVGAATQAQAAIDAAREQRAEEEDFMIVSVWHKGKSPVVHLSSKTHHTAWCECDLSGYERIDMRDEKDITLTAYQFPICKRCCRWLRRDVANPQAADTP